MTYPDTAPGEGGGAMKRPHTNESHLTCPTCWSDIDNKDLKYFGSAGGPHQNDDILNCYEEVGHLVQFLGALAQAAPLAVAQGIADGMSEAPAWVGQLSWLADELAEETERRLKLLLDAGRIWEQRAEQSPERKEG